MTKMIAWIASAATLVGLAAALGFVLLAPPRQCGSSSVAGGMAEIGGPFTLVNNKGEQVTERDVITGPTLVYFGFTYCPDVCPLDLARNAEVVDILSENGIDLTPVFISVDPERDTPMVLADYVSVMHPKMIGLTGTAAQVDTAVKAYKAYAQKNGDGADYVMDHTTFSYLMGPDGMWEFFRRDVPAEEMAETIACFVDQA